MQALSTFLAAHPAFAAFLASAALWRVVSALLTILFKPQTPEAYAKLAAKHPRLAEVWRLVGAWGVDPIKAAIILRGLLSPLPAPSNDKDSQ